MANLIRLGAGGDRRLGIGLVAALVALALVRIALGGWGPVAPDDARYLYVGLSVLDGQGAVNPNGSLFLLRSPVYGLVLATGSTVFGGDPLIGGRIVAVALSLLGLVGAVRLGWLLGGPGGAVGTAIALVATPIVWRLVPTLRIDLPQTAMIVAVLIAVRRPTPRRWAIGGVMLGFAILVKETALPLLVLPVALVGSVSLQRLARLAVAFIGAAAVTAAWWWVVVWLATGDLFPLNALAVIEARDVDVPLRLGPSALPLLLTMAGAWPLLAWRARRATEARILLVAAAALVPAAGYAASQGLNARNFAGLAVLSAIAVGMGGAWLVAGLRESLVTGSRRADHVLAKGALVAIGVAVLALSLVGQRDVGGMPSDRLANQLAAWLDTNAPDGGRIVMAFREREEMALRLFNRATTANLPITRVDAAMPPETYLWMGLRDRQLFGYPRTGWVSALTDPPADILVLVGAHPFTPFDLTAEAGMASRLGLTQIRSLGVGGDRAEIFAIDAAQAAASTPDVPLHLSAAATAAWLDLAVGEDALCRLVAARPVVTGGDAEVRAVLQRLDAGGCSASTSRGAWVHRTEGAAKVAR